MAKTNKHIDFVLEKAQQELSFLKWRRPNKNQDAFAEHELFTARITLSVWNASVFQVCVWPKKILGKVPYFAGDSTDIVAAWNAAIGDITKEVQPLVNLTNALMFPAKMADQLDNVLAKSAQNAAAMIQHRPYRRGEGSSHSTSLQGYFDTSFAKLVKLFGEPNGPTDCYKVSTEWVLNGPDGKTVTIYDYKDTELYDSELPSVEKFRKKKSFAWHIGAQNKEVADKFIAWLKDNVK